MFSKVLVANRGEIAVRAFRAAYELGAATVAVFPYEDRNSVHRLKADEAYQIGERGHPVRAYLDVDEIIRVAPRVRRGRDLPRLRLPVREPGAGPGLRRRRHHLHRPAGRGARAGRQQGRARMAAAKAAGVPVLRSTPPSADMDELVAGAEEIGFPVFVKAVAGGGGRGMRRVDDPARAARGARGGDARGRGRVRRPDRVPRAGGGRPAPHRGADPGRRRRATSCTCSSATARCSAGTRRWSRSRRHRTSTDELRAGACARDAVAFATSIDYVNAGTVEFLLDTEGSGPASTSSSR